MSLHLLANPPLSDQAIWAIVGVGGMIGLYLLMRPRGKHKVDPLSSGLKFPLARQRSVEQQMTNLLVELSDMARQITAQLDTRAAKLELLIREADEKLAAPLLKQSGNGARTQKTVQNCELITGRLKKEQRRRLSSEIPAASFE